VTQGGLSVREHAQLGRTTVRRSTDRIIVSHAGTLPRSPELQELFVGGDATKGAFEAALPGAVKDVVKHQADVGIDVVNDGEFSKRGGFLGYVRERMTGFEARPDLAGQHRDAGVIGRDKRDFPGFYAAGLGMFNFGNQQSISPVAGGFDFGPFVAEGPLVYIGHANVAADIARLKAACEGLDVEPYLPAVAPGTIEHWLWRGENYKTDEEFLFAIADVMHEEYKAITDAGVVLQIDDPDMPDAWQMFPTMTVEEYRNYASLRAEAQNHALRGLPESLVRFHVCWGSQHGPHRDDIPLKDIVDIIFSVNAECYSIEASNGRHAHEWKVFEDFKLPDGKSLMPGVIGHSSDVVEHPELVAERIVRYANLVGRENVIAGTDCGVGSRVGHEEIAWAKLEDMARGAAIATKQLWK
jgi:5-methyltetrahydropteroyltriglutamate--homocysteine methyltransferase